MDIGTGQRPEGSITRRMRALRRINNEQGMLNLNDDFFFEGIIFIKPSNHHRLQRGCCEFAFVTQPKQFYDLRLELVVGNFNWF